MAITYFGSVSIPVDNGANTTNPTVIIPPSNMQIGDIVILCVSARQTTAGTLAISEAGGQTWNAGTQRNGTSHQTQMFWCKFNGTWAANPSVSMGGTTCNTVVMHVFRPGSGDFGVDVAESSSTYAAPASPYTVTITGITTQTNGVLVFAFWASRDDNTWSNLTSGWSKPWSAQYRNTSGSDTSQTHAYKIQESAGGTGNVSQNQATLGGDLGARFIIAFKEISQGEQHSGSGSISSNGSLSGSIKKSGKGPVLASIKGMLAALGIVAMFGIAGISGGGSQVAIGKKTIIANSSISGSGSIVTIGEKSEGEEHSGVALISGNGSFISEGIKNSINSIAASVNGDLLTSGKKTSLSLTSISTGGIISSNGEKGIFTITFISGEGNIGVQAEKMTSGEGIIAGIGFVIIQGQKTIFGETLISGNGNLIASGTKEEESRESVAQISGNGKLIINGSKITGNNVAISENGILNGGGSKESSDDSDVSGGGSISATGMTSESDDGIVERIIFQPDQKKRVFKRGLD